MIKNGDKVIIKSKFSMVLWCIKNGIIKPSRSFFSKFKHKEGTHNYFAYGKFQRSGSVGKAYRTSPEGTFEVNGYHYHKDLLKSIK